MRFATRRAARTSHACLSGAFIVVVLVALAAGRLGAADPLHPPVPSARQRHVRPLDPSLHHLIAAGVSRSAAFRTLVSRLDASAVIVYVQRGVLPSGLIGRLTFVGASQNWRYLRIEIDCRQTVDNQVAALGHELQHAVEIAEAEDVVSHGSLRRLYQRIGFAGDAGSRQFESDAARDAAAIIRRELSTSRRRPQAPPRQTVRRY